MRRNPRAPFPFKSSRPSPPPSPSREKSEPQAASRPLTGKAKIQADLKAKAKVPSFGELLRKLAIEPERALVLGQEPAPLGGLSYEKELELKNATLRKFWEMHRLPDKPTRVIASPTPRHYRSTSKRKLISQHGRWAWDFFAERPAAVKGDKGDAESPWILESPEHEAVYRKVLEKLSEGPYQSLAHHLNFLIVRGAGNLMVLFNVFRLSGEVVRKAKLLAEHLAKLPGIRVVAAQLFFDPTRSNYYLEGSARPLKLKRLFGPDYLPIPVSGREYFLHPAGFFQVNLGILPRLLEEVQLALKPKATDRFLDLYSGCGLFTLPIAEACGSAVGVELSLESCEAAKKAAGIARLKNTRFFAGKIDPHHLPKLLPPADGTPEILLLDPPRQGTAPGLTRALADRKPRRVAQLFCDMDVMPGEIDRWRKQGYMVAKVVPFDMFPGTDNLEVLVVLLPDKYGLLYSRTPATGAEAFPLSPRVIQEAGIHSIPPKRSNPNPSSFHRNRK